MLRDNDSAELVIRQAHVFDPATGLDGTMDVRISSGRIAEIGEQLRGPRELDADGLHLFPGFVDVHAHWRTPGREDEEYRADRPAAAGALRAPYDAEHRSIVAAPSWLRSRPTVERESRVRAHVSPLH